MASFRQPFISHQRNISQSDEDDALPYPYTNLKHPTQSLRLLRLRGARDPSSDINCDLITRDLFNDNGEIAIRDIEFSALSWTWGADVTETAHFIYVHERDVIFKLEVRKNLLDALIALRWPNKNRMLWVDAVCINQESVIEKNHQVQLMSLIYGLAKKVLVWVGKADENSRTAIRFIRSEILRVSRFNECYRPEAAPNWRALLNFMRRRWFSRSWIIQEIALANDAEIICGKQEDDRIHWDDFADAVQLFVDVETSSHRISAIIQQDPEYHHIPRIFEHISSLPAAVLVEATRKFFSKHKEDRDRGTQRAPIMKLEHLASHFSVFNVSVPHDSIYALLAIARDAVAVAEVATPGSNVSKKIQNGMIKWAVSHALGTSARPFPVDYGKSYVETCRQFVQFCIYGADPFRALDILCRPWSQPQDKLDRYITNGTVNTGHASRTEKIPSWVCQVSSSSHVVHPSEDSDVQLEPIVSRKNADSLVGTTELSAWNYNATGRERINFRCLRFREGSDHYSMFALGFELDEVVDVQAASQGGNIPIEWAYACGWTDPYEQLVPEEFWRTLVADRGRLSVTPPTYFSRTCQEAFASAFRTGYLRPSDYISHGHSSVLAEFCRRVEVVVWNRALIKTKGGRIGLASKGVRNGDKVCILYGCSVPVILRKFQKEEKEFERELKEKEKEKKKKWAYHYKNFIAAIERRRQQTSHTTSKPPTQQRSHTPSKLPIQQDTPTDVDYDAYDPDPFSAQTPTEHYHLFQGGCYIHGMMDGQAVQHKNAKKIQQCLFELR